MTIFYNLGAATYVNITNACPCDCTFCIRNISDGVGSADTLWLPHEPTFDEIKAAFDAHMQKGGFAMSGEIVFCGYGEPMARADIVHRTAIYMKDKLPLRLNTNGLVRLLQAGYNMQQLAQFDTVSVSLNAPNAQLYEAVTRPRMPGAYEEMLAFARDAREFSQVQLSIVGGTIPQWAENECRQIAEDMNVLFRIR
jgi:TatD family-associated radical SAM protein